MALISDYTAIGNGNRTSFDINRRSSSSFGEKFFALENRFTESISVVQSIEWVGLTELCALNAAAVGFAGGRLHVTDLHGQGIFTLTRFRTYATREEQRQTHSYSLTRNVETTLDISNTGLSGPTMSLPSSKRTYPFNLTVTPRAASGENALWVLDLYGDAVTLTPTTWSGTGSRTVSIPTPSIVLAQSWIGTDNPGAVSLEVYV